MHGAELVLTIVVVVDCAGVYGAIFPSPDNAVAVIMNLVPRNVVTRTNVVLHDTLVVWRRRW